MVKIWFIDIKGKQEGPYSEAELREDERITPDTYVWREGWEQWRRLREVPELKNLFRDDEPVDEPVDSTGETEKAKGPVEDELIIDYRQEPPYLFWLITAAIILLYMIVQLYWKY